MFSWSRRMKPITSAATIALEKVLVERRPRDLKLGYLTVLTIIAARKIKTATMKYFQLPRVLSFSLSLITKSVKEATRPAAEGMGKPRNSLLLVADSALKQLKRARRKAPQMR